MSFDPTKPATNTEVLSAELRDQFNGLKDLIDAVPAGPPGPAGQDGATGPTGPPGPNFTMRGNWQPGMSTTTGDVVVYEYQLYVAMADFYSVQPGTDANWKALSIVGPAGPAGEVTTANMNASTANNVDTFTALSLTVSDPPTQTEVQTVVSKLNDLIAALKRV